MSRFDITVSCESKSFHMAVEADSKAEAIQQAKYQVGPDYRDWKFTICGDSCPDC